MLWLGLMITFAAERSRCYREPSHGRTALAIFDTCDFDSEVMPLDLTSFSIRRPNPPLGLFLVSGTPTQPILAIDPVEITSTQLTTDPISILREFLNATNTE